MIINLQPILENEHYLLVPLAENDFDELFSTAADENIWKQHPNKDRWKREVFVNFFDGAMQSNGAFKIIDKNSNDVIGSTRFYDFDAQNKSILIGYTFYATKYWGKGANRAVKTIMLNYIFDFVEKVIFHVGAENLRSQMAMTKLGAQKTGEVEVAYFGETTKRNFVYEITKSDWENSHLNSN